MHISPVGFNVYQPFLMLSRYCADRLTDLYEKTRSQVLDNRYAKSILGRIATCSTAESIGALTGGYAGAAVMRTALGEIGKHGFPFFLRYQTPLLCLFVLQHKTSRIALPLLGIAAIQLLIPVETLSQWGAIGGQFVGELAGRNVGIILGGYAALRATQSNIPFWDNTVQCDSYLVGMSKYLVAGEVFDTVIVRSTIPYLNVPINVGRGGLGLVVKTVAYNSNPVISTLKDSFREKKVSHEVLIPLLVKMFCSRYCEANSVPITSQLINIVSQTVNVIPDAAHQFRFLLRQPALFGPLEAGIHRLSQLSDQFATIFMRALHEYVDLFKSSPELQEAYRKYLEDPKAHVLVFKAALKTAMKGASVLSPAFDPFKETIETTSKSLIEAIQQAEHNLTGHVLTKEPSALKETLTIHLKYFLIYVVLHYDAKPLSSDEEKAFFTDLNSVFFSLYRDPSCAHKIARSTSKITHALLSSFFCVKKWVYPLIEQPEEKAIFHSEIQIVEEYCAPKKANILQGSIIENYTGS